MSKKTKKKSETEMVRVNQGNIISIKSSNEEKPEKGGLFAWYKDNIDDGKSPNLVRCILIIDFLCFILNGMIFWDVLEHFYVYKENCKWQWGYPVTIWAW